MFQPSHIIVISLFLCLLSACETNRPLNETTSKSMQTREFKIGGSKPVNVPILRRVASLYEGFEGGGWNAVNNSFSQHKPGLNERLAPTFKFHQMQGPHSFQAEQNIVRLGEYSAKLHWKHNKPGQWNFSPEKIDNPDRKAMFHGPNASSHMATVWYGFSVYFPAEHTKLSEGQEALFFQVHGARDLPRDGLQNGKREPNRVPPIALNIAADGFTYSHSWDANKFSTSSSGEGQRKYRIEAKLSEYQDRWLDVVLQVRTNPYEEKGFVKIWIDGKQLVNLSNVKIGYNDDKGFYPSYGWYLWGNNATREHDMLMYLDEIRQVEAIGANYYDVASGAF